MERSQCFKGGSTAAIKNYSYLTKIAKLRRSKKLKVSLEWERSKKKSAYNDYRESRHLIDISSSLWSAVYGFASSLDFHNTVIKLFIRQWAKILYIIVILVAKGYRSLRGSRTLREISYWSLRGVEGNQAALENCSGRVNMVGYSKM